MFCFLRSKLIRVENFEAYFKKQQADSNCGFAEEYEVCGCQYCVGLCFSWKLENWCRNWEFGLGDCSLEWLGNCVSWKEARWACRGLGLDDGAAELARGVPWSPVEGLRASVCLSAPHALSPASPGTSLAQDVRAPSCFLCRPFLKLSKSLKRWALF